MNKDDCDHESVSLVLDTINEVIILPVPAITEVGYLVLRDLGVEALAKFLNEIPATNFVLEAPTPDDYNRSAEILCRYNDANIDFVDACIVAIAERRNITKF